MKDMSEQQNQTLNFFDSFALQWREAAEGTSETEFNLIKNRNATVKMVAERIGNVTRVLDIGCGSGELCLELAGLGIETMGIDFSEKMIALCEEKKAELGAHKATFIHQSIFDYRGEPESLDLISMLGLVEYISWDELGRLLEMCYGLLKNRGSLVMGSRNRLFNVLSYNSYTAKELERGMVSALVEEATAIAEAKTHQEAIKLLLQEQRTLVQLDNHPGTGITVETRHQYTPRQLVHLFEQHGFHAEHIFAVNYHGIPPRYKGIAPEVHVRIANGMQAAAFDLHYLIPFCSTVVLHARKS
ncbi:MAG: class I SAM-dependent methyltransferase [Desulfomonilaceae bacterium]